MQIFMHQPIGFSGDERRFFAVGGKTILVFQHPEPRLPHQINGGWAGDEGQRNMAAQIAPAVPAIQLRQNIGSGNKDEIRPGKSAFQNTDRIDTPAGSGVAFQITDNDARTMPRQGPAFCQTFGIAARFLFERILRRNQPPDAIELQVFQGNMRCMHMASMGRIERPTQQTNAHAAPAAGVQQMRRGKKDHAGSIA